MRIFYHERAPFASVFLCENEDFACAQYDVKSPIVGVADTSPEGGSEINCVIAREHSDRGNPLE